jgi:hypothetical protein
MKETKKETKPAKKRTILVILKNRFIPSVKTRFIEVDCDDKGNIFAERPLKNEPAQPIYAEVWENDDGKTEISSCNSFKRKYRHALEKKNAA